MSSTDTKGISEESSFEIIGDGQPNKPNVIQIVSTSSPPSESKVDDTFLRRRRRNKKVAEENKNSDSDLESVQLAVQNSDKEVKSESESELNGDKGDKNGDSGVKLNIEEEILKLKAKVKSLTKFKSRVQQKESSEDEDDDAGSIKDEDAHQNDKDEMNADKTEVVTLTANGMTVTKTINTKKTSKADQARPYSNSELRGALEFFEITLAVLFLMLLGLVIKAWSDHANRDQVRQEIREIIEQTIKQNIKGTVKTKLTHTIFLHSKKNYEGLIAYVHYWDLNDNLCYNFDTSANDFASSIDTQEECVYVFKNSDCKGKKLKILPETPNQHDLSLWGLDKAVSSIQACYKHKD